MRVYFAGASDGHRLLKHGVECQECRPEIIGTFRKLGRPISAFSRQPIEKTRIRPLDRPHDLEIKPSENLANRRDAPLERQFRLCMELDG